MQSPNIADMYAFKYNRAATNLVASDNSNTFHSNVAHYNSIMNMRYGKRRLVDHRGAADDAGGDDLLHTVRDDGSVIQFSTVTNERREMNKRIQQMQRANLMLRNIIHMGIRDHQQLSTVVTCLHIQNEDSLPYRVNDLIPIMCLKKRCHDLTAAGDENKSADMHRRLLILTKILDSLERVR